MGHSCIHEEKYFFSHCIAQVQFDDKQKRALDKLDKYKFMGVVPPAERAKQKRGIEPGPVVEALPIELLPKKKRKIRKMAEKLNDSFNYRVV